MAPPSLVVVGASAGGVEALSRLVATLPGDLPAAVVVVLHVAARAPTVLPDILARAGALPVHLGCDGAPLVAGHVYVAPPDHHLLVRDGHLAVVRGPRENGSRPAVDPLFRSAARAHGARVIGVVLSGMLGDGAHGLAYIKARGGAAFVQAPADAQHPGMPEAAIAQVAVDAVLPVAELGAAVVREARRRAILPLEVLMADAMHDEVELDGVGSTDGGVGVNQSLGGELAPFTCPECRGPLWEIRDGLPVRFRCRVGHSYDAATLVHDKETALEGALWTAITALEENAALARQMARRAGEWGRPAVMARFVERAELLATRARTVRAVIDALADDGAARGVADDAAAEPARAP